MSTAPRPDAAAFRGPLAATYQHWYDASQANPLDPVLRELTAIRTAALNGCSFCLRMHLASARKLGRSQAWMDSIPAWRTSPVFTAKERAILAWTDAVTVITGGHDDDAAYAALAEHATPEEICLITAHIAQNNLWNRIAGPLRWE